MVSIKLRSGHERWGLTPRSRRRPIRRYLAFSFLLTAAGLGLSLLLSYLPLLRLEEVAVIGAKVVSPAAVVAATDDYLAGRYFHLWPKRHAWWYPRAGLIDHLKATFPQLAGVAASARSGRLAITVAERQPTLLSCSPDRCLFIDQEGIAYAPAPRFSPGVFLEWQTDRLEQEPPAAVIPAAAVTRLLKSRRIFEQVIALLELPDWQINRFTATTDGDFIFWVDPVPRRREQVAAWQILIDAETPPLNLGNNLHTALSTLLTETTGQTWPSLQYIDLRFGQKVYYKL